MAIQRRFIFENRKAYNVDDTIGYLIFLRDVRGGDGNRNPEIEECIRALQTFRNDGIVPDFLPSVDRFTPGVLCLWSVWLDTFAVEEVCSNYVVADDVEDSQEGRLLTQEPEISSEERERIRHAAHALAVRPLRADVRSILEEAMEADSDEDTI